MNISVDELLNIKETDARAIFEGVKYPWEALAKIKDFILEYAKNLPDDFERIDEFVWVGKGTTIDKSVLIKGPAIIGYNCEIRQCAYIRENVIIGNDVVVGNSSEVKNSILFNKVQVPHYNYVGDSVLGYKSHMGAGSITSNVKSDKKLVVIKTPEGGIETGMKKFGAMLGDNVEVGCGTVLNPGSVVGKGTNIYPLSMVRGYVPANSIYKKQGEVVEKR